MRSGIPKHQGDLQARAVYAHIGAWMLPGLFFLSGASSLIFQNLWQRMMTLELGASAPATTAILTSFFCGIAIGSFLGGRLLERSTSALSFYWRVELCIGLFGLAVPLFLSLVRLVNLRFIGGLEPYPLAAFSFRFALAVLATLPASFSMGATIPTMNRLLSEARGSIGGSVALAFGSNTLGAVLGCLAAGLAFVPWWGVTGTLALAAGINVLIALTSIWLARRNRLLATDSGALPRNTPRPTSLEVEGVAYPQLLVAGYFLGGALALGYELVWMRSLALYSTSSTLTFTLALSVYLLGFGLGSLLLYPVLAKRMSGRAVFALSNIGTGASTLLLIPLVYEFPYINRWLIFEPARRHLLSWTRVAAVEFGLSFIMIFLPTLFMGLAYPAICRALVPSIERAGRDTGRLYFLGTIGSMLGVLFFGIVAVPTFGFVATIVQLCGASLVIGAAVVLAERRLPGRQRGGLLVLASATAIGVWIFAAYGQPFVNISYDAALPMAAAVPPAAKAETRLLRYREGATGTVIVSEEQSAGGPPQRVIMVDGKPVSATYLAAQIDAKMLAHIPLLLHPNPRRALTVGFGSGGTSWSLTRHPIQAECVEIEKEVVRSAPLFNTQNFDVLSHPRFRLILNDARHHLLTTSTRYDAIATDVTTLRYKHNSSLYTYEYFQLMKARLTEGGVACAWVPMSAISQREYKILLRSFGAVFPHATMWYVNHRFTNFAILIGTPEPLTIDLRRVREALAKGDIAADLHSIGVRDPLQFVHFLHLDSPGYDAFVGPGMLHIDDYPVLEFSSPASAFNMEQLFVLNLQATMPFRIVDYSAVLKRPTEDEQNRLAHYTASAQLTMQAVVDHLAAEFSAEPREAAQLHARAVDQMRRSLGQFREDDTRMFVLNQMEVAQHAHLSVHPELPHSLRTRVQDDFDGPLALSLFRQVGKARPTDDPHRHARWSEQMQRFGAQNGFVKEAGRNGGSALQLLPVAGATTVGFFSPLEVEPDRSYQVSFWSQAQLEPQANAGLIVLEFDAVSLSGEQPPDFIVQDHVVGVHGPANCSTSSSWEASSLSFRTSNRCRMIHIVFFLDQATATNRVLFDDVDFHRQP